VSHSPAIDTEFHREKTYFPQVAVVQIADSHGIAVVDARDAEARLRGPTGDDVVLELCRDGQCRTVRFARGR